MKKRWKNLIEASAIVLEELESLRRQKREWELERANLLAEQEHLQGKLFDLEAGCEAAGLNVKEEPNAPLADPIAQMEAALDDPNE